MNRSASTLTCPPGRPRNRAFCSDARSSAVAWRQPVVAPGATTVPVSSIPHVIVRLYPSAKRTLGGSAMHKTSIIASIAFVCIPAHAQTESKEPVANDIVVTGTRSEGRAALASSAPIDVVSGDTIVGTGFSDLGLLSISFSPRSISHAPRPLPPAETDATSVWIHSRKTRALASTRAT